jgi:ribosomal protein S18 acetylase RimI-like enzyme
MERFKVFLEIRSNETLASFLEPEHVYVGKEKMKILSHDVKVFSDEYGSHRIMKLDADGKAISVIQVLSNKKGVGHVANAFTLPQYRQKGIGTELVKHARNMFPKKLTFSTDLSDDGAAFVQAMTR